MKGHVMLKNLTRKVAGAFAAGLFALGVAALVAVPVLIVPAQAQRSPAPRLFPEQMTAYIRATVNFNSCVYVSLVCSVKIGAVPYNSFMVRAYSQTVTTWNAGTSASIGLGTVVPGVNIMASVAVTTAGNAVAQSVAAGGLGITVTGNGIAQSGALGGFDIFATITIVGALPTAGSTVVVLEYIQPNDGACAPVPQGATAAGC
jgi:hypothetical protein